MSALLNESDFRIYGSEKGEYVEKNNSLDASHPGTSEPSRPGIQQSQPNLTKKPDLFGI